MPANERVRAGAVLGRAFSDDPLWAAILTDPDKRPEQLAAMFTGLTRTTVAAQGLAETDPAIDAIALWLRPGRNVGLGAMLRSGVAMPRFAMGLPTQDRKRMLAVHSQLEKRKKVLMPEPHWYLSAIGVDPGRQGEGLGSALVNAGIGRADRDDTPIYLETQTERNVAFYQRLGFHVLEENLASGFDLPVWSMVRLSRTMPS